MPIELHDEDALISAAWMSDLPVAFLVGAPFSADQFGGVPDVSGMIDVVREEIAERAAAKGSGFKQLMLEKFEAQISSKSGAEAYQAAMRWLQASFSQDAVNRVISKAVMSARLTDRGRADVFDDPSDWYIPSGAAQLASLMAGERERFPGPILTTNFDHLLLLALKASGAIPKPYVLDSDGAVPRFVHTGLGEIEIIHLHGYWRGADTLHTPAQLTSPRPKLSASLRRILQQRTLVVLAYGGWNDIFMSSFAELLNDDQATFNVLWCFYESDKDQIAWKYEKLFGLVQPAIARGRFVAYGGINCHDVIGKIRSLSGSKGKVEVSPALVGWERIDASYLEALQPMRQNEVLRYFDGAEPSLRTAASGSIPRRSVVELVVDRLAQARAAGGCSIQVIRGAAGEGKSTALLQAAVESAGARAWSVLCRSSPDVGLAPDQVLALDPGRDWLLVADDADNLVAALGETLAALNARGRSGVHFLVAARDSDWRQAGGDKASFEAHAVVHPSVQLGALDEGDATAVVQAWSAYGGVGLGELAKVDAAFRVRSLLEARQGIDGLTTEGSFFGALLRVRFGEGGLRGHVRSLLADLQEVRIEGGNRSLFDAAVYVAACHGAGVPGVRKELLADLLDVPRNWVQSRVIHPLGAEAISAFSGGHVFTRHKDVAQAILLEAFNAFGVDLSEVWREIIRQTIDLGNEVEVGQTFGSIVHVGPRLLRALPREIPEHRRWEIAIAAAEASADYKRDWLSCVVGLGRTYRGVQQVGLAAEVFRSNVSEIASKSDRHAVRSYWYEWSVCEGESGGGRSSALANAWLSGISLSDAVGVVPVSEKDVRMGCGGLGISFSKLCGGDAKSPFSFALRAAAYLGRRTGSDPRRGRYFDQYDREANAMRIAHPSDVAEAMSWLERGIFKARSELSDEFLRAVVDRGRVSFRGLREFFESQRNSGARSNRPSGPSRTRDRAPSGA